jgi:hypothetical protein
MNNLNNSIPLRNEPENIYFDVKLDLNSTFNKKYSEYRFHWINLANQWEEFYRNEEQHKYMVNELVSNYKHRVENWYFLEQHEIIDSSHFDDMKYISNVIEILKSHNEFYKFKIIDIDLSKSVELNYKRKLKYYESHPIITGNISYSSTFKNVSELPINLDTMIKLKDKYVQNGFQKPFLSFMGRPTYQRKRIFNFLSKNLSEKCFVSYNTRNTAEDLWIESAENRSVISKEYDFPFNSDMTSANGMGKKFGQGSWVYSNYKLSNLYLSTFCNILCETKDGNEPYMQITEKLDKCIIGLQPFIIVGTTFYLKTIKELGFKTFSNWWDESYDEIKDQNDRRRKIIEIITNISTKYSDDDLKIIYKEMEPTLHHNFKLMESYGEKYKQFYINSKHEGISVCYNKDTLNEILVPYQDPELPDVNLDLNMYKNLVNSK